MTLNKDCVRDVLIFLETQPFFLPADHGTVTAEEVYLSAVAQALPQYTINELYYVLRVLSAGDYIEAVFFGEGNDEIACAVSMITYHGHELLDSIRDERQWASVKKCLSAVRNYSLSAIQAVASGVTEAAISKWIAGTPEA